MWRRLSGFDCDFFSPRLWLRHAFASVQTMVDLETNFDSTVQLSGDGLACRRGARTVFEGLAFDLQAGDFLCLKGRNGSGKSTFLRCLSGFLPAFAGTLRLQVEDETEDHLPPDFFLQAGHQNGLKPNFTLRDNARFFCLSMTGDMPSNEKLLEAAKVFDLAGLLDDPVQYFSSGQRHRASLMRFALVRRQVWLMDEPTVGLDTANRAALGKLIASHTAHGGIVIAATHDPLGVEGRELNMNAFAPKAVGLDEAWL